VWDGRHARPTAATRAAPLDEGLPMRTAALKLLVTLVVSTSGGPALGHHSFAAEFDAQRPVTLKGAVAKWEMINPHGWITLDVTDGGKTTRWMIETSNPNGLMRLGWTKNSLQPGDEITVDGYLAKDGSSTANASRITLADGRKVFAGSPTTPQDPPASAPNGN
jgi:hypothetical protein